MKACPFCAEEIQDAAIVCKHCGRDLTPRLETSTVPASPAAPPAKGRGKGCLIGLAVLGLLMIIGLLNPRPKPTPRSTTTPSGSAAEADVRMPSVSSSALFEAFQANEVAAKREYGGGVYDISGQITNIGEDILGSPYVVLAGPPDALFGVQAMFPRASADVVAGVSKGQFVTLRCKVDSKLGNVLVRECKKR